MQYLFKSVVAILAFVFGIIGVLYIAPLPTIRPVQLDPPIVNIPPPKPADDIEFVPFSELMRNPRSYDLRIIRTRVQLQSVKAGGLILFDDITAAKALPGFCGQFAKGCVALLGYDPKIRGLGAQYIVTGRFDVSPEYHRNSHGRPYNPMIGISDITPVETRKPTSPPLLMPEIERK